jgi:predicted amidophosphoribosyltransferase
MKGSKLTKFDSATREAHSFLGSHDDCYYFIEYTAKKPYNHSDANSFISNLKKKPSVKGTYQWNHKMAAIRLAAETLTAQLPPQWVKKSTFVPIPPSKATDHAEYDDRMSKVLAKLDGADVRELVIQKKSMEATHVSTKRHTIDELVANYEIDEEEAGEKAPTHIVIVDDMMTAGAHYRAMRKVLKKRFPGVPISGVFLARRIFPDSESEEENGE